MGQCLASGQGKEKLQESQKKCRCPLVGPIRWGPALKGLLHLSNTSLTCLPPAPDPHSRVCLTSPDPEDPLSSYINANYIRVCSPIPVTSP